MLIINQVVCALCVSVLGVNRIFSNVLFTNSSCVSRSAHTQNKKMKKASVTVHFIISCHSATMHHNNYTITCAICKLQDCVELK